MIAGGLKVLSKSENVAINRSEIFHDLEYFIGSLSESEHEPGFGYEPALLRAVKHLKGSLVLSLRPDAMIKTRDCLGVMIQDIGKRVEHDVQRELLPFKIR